MCKSCYALATVSAIMTVIMLACGLAGTLLKDQPLKEEYLCNDYCQALVAIQPPVSYLVVNSSQLLFNYDKLKFKSCDSFLTDAALYSDPANYIESLAEQRTEILSQGTYSLSRQYARFENVSLAATSLQFTFTGTVISEQSEFVLVCNKQFETLSIIQGAATITYWKLINNQMGSSPNQQLIVINCQDSSGFKLEYISKWTADLMFAGWICFGICLTIFLISSCFGCLKDPCCRQSRVSTMFEAVSPIQTEAELERPEQNPEV